jgi:hypothetical protein
LSGGRVDAIDWYIDGCKARVRAIGRFDIGIFVRSERIEPVTMFEKPEGAIYGRVRSNNAGHRDCDRFNASEELSREIHVKKDLRKIDVACSSLPKIKEGSWVDLPDRDVFCDFEIMTAFLLVGCLQLF